VIVALVLASAFLHAAGNALLRVERDKERALVAAVGVATLLAAAIAAARWARGEVPFPGGAAVGWALAAGVLEWVYFASLARALERGTLGPVYTVSRGGAIVLVWPISIAAFGETLAVTAACGTAVVLAGLVLASRTPGAVRARSLGAGIGWAIACALSIAGYHLAYKGALRAGGGPSAVFALALVLASTINLIGLGAAGRRAASALVRGRPGRIVLMGLVCGGSFLILMEALARGGTGYVLTLRNTSVLFATALAAAIGERPARIHIAGAILVATGAVLMAW
jgi:drug/metabolite transporter (DMT)-like permease